MLIYAERYEFTRNETWGKLSIPSHKFKCDTLEDEARARGVKIMHHTCIPAGVYKVIVNMSARFKKMLPLIFNIEKDYSVSDGAGVTFTGIRIHGGVNDQHTSGCVLVGTRVNGSLTNSSEVMEQLMNILNSTTEPIQLIITNKQKR